MRLAILAGSLLVLPLTAGGAAAQSEAPRLSLEVAAERALAHFPSLEAARAAWREAEATAGEAAAAWLPTLRVSASATRYQKPMVVSPIHGFTPGATPPFDETLIQSGTALTYTLFDGGARGGRVRGARARADAAEAALDATEEVLLSRVIATYLEVLSDARVLEAHDRRLAALRLELGRARQRLEVGKAARIDVLRVEAALAGAEAERVRFVHALDNAERDLARLIGAGPEATRADLLEHVTLTEAALPERTALLERALEANAAARQARREAAAGDAGVAVAKGLRWPELRAAGRYLTFGDGSGRHTGEWNAGVELSYPLFTGGALSRSIDRAEAARRRVRERLRLVEIEVSQEIDRALSAVEEARALRKSLETAAARSAEVARIERLRLDLGTGTETDYLSAEAEALEARARLVQAEYREIAARAELARATGELSPAWIAATLETPR